MKTTLLICHIIAGHFALIAGAWAMISRKGKKHHVRSGRVFFWSMLVVALTAIALSMVTNSLFFLTIGLFVFYQDIQGYTAIRDKSLKPKYWTYALWVIGGLNGMIMIWTGQIVLMVFGGIQSMLVLQDSVVSIRALRGRKISVATALRRHVGQMIGAYIGAITAFLVVNVQVQGSWGYAVWLGPTLLLVPVIIFWNRRYRG